MQYQPRRPAGTPIGGQFAPTYRPDAVGLELTDDDFFDFSQDQDDAQATDDLGVNPELDSDNGLRTGPFGIDLSLLDRARDLVRVAQNDDAAHSDTRAQWSSAESAVTAVGRLVADVIDAEVERRHPGGFADDIESERACTDAYSDVTLEVIGAIRHLGLPLEESLHTVDSQKPAITLLNRVAAQFPSDWLAASQEKDPPMRARVTPHRAHYSPVRRYWGEAKQVNVEVNYAAFSENAVPAGVEAVKDSLGHWHWTATELRERRVRSTAAEITVPSPTTRPIEARSTATHELTHRLEHANPQLGRLEDAFIYRRCRNEDGMLKQAVPLSRRSSEMVRDGNFVNPYIGKIYPTSTFFEVLSTGTESIFAGAYGGLIGRSDEKPDADHRAFTLGCLAAA